MFKRHLLTGLLLWIPLAITLWVLHLIVTTMDQTLSFLPHDAVERVYFPGLGLLLTLVIVWGTGVFASNLLGRQIIHFWEGVLKRIPVDGIKLDGTVVGGPYRTEEEARAVADGESEPRILQTPAP